VPIFDSNIRNCKVRGTEREKRIEMQRNERAERGACIPCWLLREEEATRRKKQQRRKNTWKLRAISTIGIGIGN
jgi:hypothetical protein